MTRLVTSLSPNAERDDIHLALRLLMQPGEWENGYAIKDLERAIGAFFHSEAFTFESGRTALSSAIQALGLPSKSEILLQAFTCIAVPNSVLWAGCIPVYTDADPSTFTIDLKKCEQQLTTNTRAILVQHTFGIPTDMDALMAFARKYNLLVIEDCAHSFGSRWNGQLLGTFGDVAIFSFGRDKSLSSVFGGVAISRNSNTISHLKRLRGTYPTPPKKWVIQQLMHPIILAMSLKMYDVFAVGKLILEAAKRLHIISKAFEPAERTGGEPSWAHHRMPNALACLALHQWKKRERFEAHRRRLVAIYQTELTHPSIIHPSLSPSADPVFLRYPIRITEKQKVLDHCRKAHIELGDWYVAPIAPKGISETAIGYDRNTTPNAVTLSEQTINLPTHINISEQDAKKIAALITYALD